MTDLPPMSPCPYAKRGAHSMVVITRETADLVLLACCECGATRHVPASAQDVPLDEMDAGEIVRRIGMDWAV